MITEIFKVVSQTEPVYVQSKKQDGGQLAKCNVHLKGIGGESESSTYLMHVMLPTGDVITYQEVYASELEECDAIIGMDIINLGHFHLDLCQGETTFTFSLPNE